ncbi:putative Transposon Tf2-1 polyprotein, partial [Rhizoctonia solani 123E]
MLDGTTTKAGKCWKKVHLEFICEQKRNSSDFLVSDIGQHEVILGGNWLKEYNPTINWATQVIQFTDDIANIASEEEADDNPLEGVPSQYHAYAKVFGEEEFTKLPPHRSYDIHIELVDEEMRINSPLYSMTDAESVALKEWLDKELAAGKIQPSNSSISSPVMFIPKKDGSRRLVVDYRKLNANTKKSVYPLPRPDDLMSKLRGAKIFSALDMRWGYNNLRVAEEDVPKTAFRTKYGLFETKVMPFGLTNAPAYFQHWVNSIFHDMLDVSVVIYLDDILIFSKNEEEHTQHVEEVLRRLQDNQLFCKASKCFFHRQELSYLGIRVSVDGFSLDPLKIQAVQEWPAPTNRKELQSFLGFANFLRRFAKDFSKIARPLNNLISPSAEWKWNTREQESFEELKRVITEAPVLAHADPNKTYYLETDASGAAMGAVLSQRQEDGRLHPIGFMSESFKGAELNWDTHDKELHAIIRSLEFWRIYLEGTNEPIIVFTDHRNLEYWQNNKTFNRRHARWHLLLAGYNFRIHYRPGKQSNKPDALSRRSDHLDIPPGEQIMLPAEIFANAAYVDTESHLQTLIERALDKDEDLEEILHYFQVKQENAGITLRRAFKEYHMEAGLLFYQNKIVVPNDEDIKLRLLHLHHNNPLAGHPGRQRTLELVTRHYWWPGMRSYIYNHVDSCEECQRARRPKPLNLPTQPLEVPTAPWQIVSYDMIVGLPKDMGHDAILVIIDSFSKYGIFVPTESTANAARIADLFLEHYWKNHGLPKKTVSDRGTVFQNKFTRALYKRLGINPHFSSAYHPESDGQTERVNPSIEHFLRIYCGHSRKDWVKWLPLAQFAYNNAPHSATSTSPFMCIYGREPTFSPSNIETEVPEANERTNLILRIQEEVASALRLSKERMTKGKPEEPPISFEVGERAWLDAKNINLKSTSSKLNDRRLGPFKVIEKISDLAYRLELPESMKVHNVFYLGLLSKVKEDPKTPFQERPPPVTIEGEEEYEVESI